ncbi:MAG TPA: hypothetical protein DCM54_17205 [Gammaproteobacteria bacterium]|nr:hypothetical protein [Gammaproteobacteria bacterium]
MSESTTSPKPFMNYRLLIACVVGFLVIAALFNEFVKPRIFPKRFGAVIEDSLFRSGRIHPDLLPSVIEDHQIDTIVTLTRDVSTVEYQPIERAITSEMGVDLVRFPLDGNGTGEVSSYIGALTHIYDELGEGRRVLVHCAAGSQRTGGVMFLYQTLVLQKSEGDAYKEMIDYDFDPERNAALLPYLVDILPEVVDALGAYGISPAAVPEIKGLAAK